MKTDWDEIILCHNRVTGRFNKGTWYYGKQILDLTHIDLDEFFSYDDPVAAALWVMRENES